MSGVSIQLTIVFSGIRECDYTPIPEGPWILENGIWNDVGVWKDEEVWID